MKRYAVVAWDYQYPKGGLNNIVAAFNNHENALAVAKEIRKDGSRDRYDEVEVIDLRTFDPRYDAPLVVTNAMAKLGLLDDLDA